MPSNFFARLDREEAIAEASARAYADYCDRRAETPSPTQPLSLRDGDLLLIGRQGAVDEKGYVELGERFELSGVVG